MRGGSGYDLNFENAPVATVAKVILGDVLNVGYTIDPRVQGTVTLASVRPVPKADALYVLENALRMSGVALVRDRTGYRLLPAAEAGPGGIDRSASAEAGQGISVVPLRYVSAQNVFKLLDAFGVKASTMRPDNGRNTLIITGSGSDRGDRDRHHPVSFDADWMRGQSVGIFPVRNSSPEPVISEIEKIMDSGEGGLSQNVIKFQPIAPAQFHPRGQPEAGISQARADLDRAARQVRHRWRQPEVLSAALRQFEAGRGAAQRDAVRPERGERLEPRQRIEPDLARRRHFDVVLRRQSGRLAERTADRRRPAPRPRSPALRDHRSAPAPLRRRPRRRRRTTASAAPSAPARSPAATAFCRTCGSPPTSPTMPCWSMPTRNRSASSSRPSARSTGRSARSRSRRRSPR